MNTQGTPQGRPQRRPDNPNRKAPVRQTGLPDPNKPVQIPKRGAKPTPIQQLEPMESTVNTVETQVQDKVATVKKKRVKEG